MPSAPEETYRSVLAHLDEDALIEMVRGALRIPSLSGEEEAAARYYADTMRGVGLEADVQPVPASTSMPASYNAVGRLRGGGGGQSLMLNGHIDHNPVAAGWTHDPFAADIVDGWIYGFVHMKAANACYIAAVDAVRRSGIRLRGDAVILHVCGELRDGQGARHALAQGVTADYFVLGEPSEMQLAPAHTISLVAKLHVLGMMKHFATEDIPGSRGVNAVEQAARVIVALGGSHKPLKPLAEGGFLTFTPREGFEGLPQLNVGSIRGGISRAYFETRAALFPDVCTVTIDFRIVPGMTQESIERDLAAFLEQFRAEEPDFRYEVEWREVLAREPFRSAPNSRIVASVAAQHERIYGQPPEVSQTVKFAASDASWMQAAGIDGILYGPSGRYLSRPDERCEVEQLIRAAQVYACVIADICT